MVTMATRFQITVVISIAIIQVIVKEVVLSVRNIIVIVMEIMIVLATVAKFPVMVQVPDHHILPPNLDYNY